MTSPTPNHKNDVHAVNLLKGLVIDGVNAAQSGHPGGAMSSMDLAYILWTEFLRFDPEDPTWRGRDRFVLSAGHESMLLYSLLHATGWLERNDLEAFRQMDSRTPGHPEEHMTPGVECTTGPLGQGCAMSVGLAIANAHLGEVMGHELFNANTWTLMGDGCMQEDVTLGAASLAGHLHLNRLVWIYDKNQCQISGTTDRSSSDDEAKVFEGFGWKVCRIDGHSHEQIRKALTEAKDSDDKPTLIIADTIMAKGAANREGDHGTHGAPFKEDEYRATMQALGIPEQQTFHWPSEVATHFQRNFEERCGEANAWKARLAERQCDNEFSKAFETYFANQIDVESLPDITWAKDKEVSTRKAFGDILAAWAEALPNMIGGSADLEPSNMTGAFAKIVGDYQAQNPRGRNLSYGVREFPMAAISNGMALHGGLVPFDATFLAFSDYSRPALRLGAIQKLRVIHEFSHDSFYLGEDGPTHQPIEHIASLRAMPGMYVMRPCDSVETEVMMRVALNLQAPSCLCLSRQNLPSLGIDTNQAELAWRGAWMVYQPQDAEPKHIIFATGSEVALALEVAKVVKARVVSVPCWELFFEQDSSYQQAVLGPDHLNRVSIEAGSTFGWERFVGSSGLMIGIDHYGASAPAGALAKSFGFTSEAVIERINQHFCSK